MPAPRIDHSLVLHVAKLASLSLAPEEVDRYTKELARIVGYVEQLDAVDTSGVLPTAHVEIARLPWRDDTLVPSLSHNDALAQAPQVDADGFAVPAFVE
jgi:aspartyl-tRNA(Asn)/glutamyl-tRNA(Gln) amidotransferase subunit C